MAWKHSASKADMKVKRSIAIDRFGYVVGCCVFLTSLHNYSYSRSVFFNSLKELVPASKVAVGRRQTDSQDENPQGGCIARIISR